LIGLSPSIIKAFEQIEIAEAIAYPLFAYKKARPQGQALKVPNCYGKLARQCHIDINAELHVIGRVG
jgi:hypothetical protein